MTLPAHTLPTVVLAGLSLAGGLSSASAATEPALTASQARMAGKWTPEQLLEHDAEWLREIGLRVPAAELWNADGGLLRAVVNIRGCTASFVSEQGLMLTNHHCVYSILQQHSTPERDLLRDGFVAERLEDELPGGNSWASVIQRLTDVTAEVEAAVPEGADDLQRYQALEAKQKELVAACEARPRRRCQVAVYDDGVRYELIEALEFSDVRLVYAPPQAVGEYGGEVDNWSWPRHTGDFALLRVYAADGERPASHDTANRPYRPQVSLRLATEGVEAGDFILVPGFPARSYRSWIADEVAERAELFFPRRSALYQDWLQVLSEEAEAGEAARLALADRHKRLANREKNSRGQLAGLARGNLLEHKRAAERDVLAWAGEQSAHRAAIEAYAELQALTAEARATWQRDFLLDQIASGPLVLDLALDLVRAATEREKPDAEREPGYQDRDRSNLRRSQERNQSQLFRPAEARLLTDLLLRLAALPAEQRPPAVTRLAAQLEGGETAGRDAWAARVDELLAETQVFDLASRFEMFEQTPAQLHARGDRLIDLAFELEETRLDVEVTRKRREGAISRLRPVWRRAVAAYSAAPIDADANGTLRVSLARVQGYSPRDGIYMLPFTRLSGLVAKHTGAEPFDAPSAVLAAAGKTLPETRWAAEALGDVPVCFLGSADTTGGNSGSPVLDAEGRVVGVNFDRVWENVANDFGYNPEVARQVSVDVRYLLWMLSEVAGPPAARLLDELTGPR